MLPDPETCARLAESGAGDVMRHPMTRLERRMFNATRERQISRELAERRAELLEAQRPTLGLLLALAARRALDLLRSLAAWVVGHRPGCASLVRGHRCDCGSLPLTLESR